MSRDYALVAVFVLRKPRLRERLGTGKSGGIRLPEDLMKSLEDLRARLDVLDR